MSELLHQQYEDALRENLRLEHELAEAKDKLYRYAHWTPDHTIEQWLAERQAKCAEWQARAEAARNTTLEEAAAYLGGSTFRADMGEAVRACIALVRSLKNNAAQAAKNAAGQVDGSSSLWESGAGSSPASKPDTERRFDSVGPAPAAPEADAQGKLSEAHPPCTGATEPASSALVMDANNSQLMRFYGVATLQELIDAQAHHIERLQAKLPPLRDTRPRYVPREG